MIAIVKYNAGNSTSVKNALDKIGLPSLITDSHEEIISADKVIFPGVGHAGPAMKYLIEKKLDKLILDLKQPVLGICLGMQLMCNKTDEDNTSGLGIFNTDVKKFPPEDIIPHMGWNNIKPVKSPLFDRNNQQENYYFVHSYYAETCDQTSAICEYILPFSAALQKDNFYGTQFHIEKSAMAGEALLKRFIAL